MAISPINSTLPYTSPNFKGAPKMTASGMSKVTSAVSESVNSGVLHTMKDKWNKGYNNVIDKAIVKPILAPIMNSDAFGKLAEKTKNIDNMPAHMATAGSIVTTATYAYTSLKTLRKDEEQKKRAKILALNQVMVTGLSTAGAYLLNDKLANKTKQLGYKFREANQGNPKLAAYMRGFDVAKSLLVFAFMYRYVAPVIVTPIASKIGNYIFNKDGGSVKKSTTQANPTIVPMEAAKATEETKA